LLSCPFVSLSFYLDYTWPELNVRAFFYLYPIIAMPLQYWIFILITLTLTTFISYSTFATARLLKHWRPDQNILLLPAENILRFILIAFCLGLGWLSGLPDLTLGWQFQVDIATLAWGFFLGLGLGIFFYLSTRWIIHLAGQRFYSSIIIEYILPANPQEFILVTLAMGPVVILEELLFRSLLLGGFSPIIPLPVLLIGLSILFGLLHSPQGLWGMVGAGLAGFLLSLIFLWQGNIFVPILAHYITNLFQIIQALRLSKTVKDSNT